MSNNKSINTLTEGIQNNTGETKDHALSISGNPINTVIEGIREDLLGKCNSISFEGLKAFTEPMIGIREKEDQIKALLPAGDQDQVGLLSDKYAEMLVGLVEVFYLAGFAECLNQFRTSIQQDINH